MGLLKDFLTAGDVLRILTAVQDAEARTSGRIRLHLEPEAGKDPLGAARKAFARNRLHKNRKHNTVLFFLGVRDRTLVVFGDDGINAKVTPKYWDKVVNTVLKDFQENEFVRGLTKGIKMIGEQMTEFYPEEKSGSGELPDAVSYGPDEEK